MKTILMTALLFITLLSPATAQSVSKESFKTVKIGSQTWMSENLNVATFRNGDKIQEVSSAAAWIKAYEDKKPAWCYYGFKATNGRKYGKLYNWFAVQDKRGLAPNGWQVSTSEDWAELARFTGAEQSAAKQLRSKSDWKRNGNGTDSVGFNGLPGGSVNAYGMFGDIGFWGSWWCYSDTETKLITGKYLKFDSDRIEDYASYLKTDGLSVRCVRKNP
jgi:uncharacterized protein (TIGR02145 family)